MGGISHPLCPLGEESSHTLNAREFGELLGGGSCKNKVGAWDGPVCGLKSAWQVKFESVKNSGRQRASWLDWCRQEDDAAHKGHHSENGRLFGEVCTPGKYPSQLRREAVWRGSRSWRASWALSGGRAMTGSCPGRVGTRFQRGWGFEPACDRWEEGLGNSSEL